MAIDLTASVRETKREKHNPNGDSNCSADGIEQVIREKVRTNAGEYPTFMRELQLNSFKVSVICV